MEEANPKNWLKKLHELDIQNKWDSVYKL